MSRIGKKPITIPDNVKITRDGNILQVEGPKGSLARNIPEGVDCIIEEGTIVIQRKSEDKRGRALHGLARTLISNMVAGVSNGFEKKLEIVGVGYRGETDGKVLKLLIGYSRPVEYTIADGITVAIEKQVNMTVSGIDKELVGKVAAEIRGLKKPEPYKGKGIRYAGETVRRKVGKSAGS
ncbi:MAG: 50S ribosomal protein L6 [Syntrophales bacterium]|nr:50S ribosomal protein L6 [Syntrophales bacterium]MDY0043166.1 50S ribosomal protein L6 [Syntrophales bacterium]